MSAADRAYDWIKDRILALTLSPGSFLSENEAAAAIGVSRTPVREALLRLAAEGLLRLVPQRGAFIAPITPREIDEVLAARQVIELDAIRTVMAAGAPLAPRLEELITIQGGHAASGDWPRFIATDREFHRVMQREVGNSVLMRFYDSLRDQQMRMGIAAVISTPPRAAQVLDEHRAILAGLVAGDVAAAEDAVRAHLRSTRSCLFEALTWSALPDLPERDPK